MDIKEIIDKINELEGDEKEAAIDAFNRILQGKIPPGGPTPPPPVAPVDPDLEDPDDDFEPEPDDIDIEDPDDILKSKKDKDDEDDSEGGDDDDDLEDPDDDKEGDKGDDKEKDKDKEGDGDGEEGEDKDKKDKKGGKGKGKGKEKDKDKDDGESDGDDGDDEIDDTDGYEGDTPKDAKAEEDKKAEKRRQTVTKSRMKKLLDKAESEAETEEEKSAVEEAKKKMEELEKKMAEAKEKGEPMDKEEFDELANGILDIIDKVTEVHYELDNEKRIKSIEKDNDDVLAKDDLDLEDDENISVDPEHKKMKAREEEKKRYEDAVKKASGAMHDMKQFKADLMQALGDQIREWQDQEEPDYSIVDRHHEEDDIATPGIRIDEIPLEDKPNVEVYFDQSGSWGTHEVKKGMEAIADILSLEKENLLNIEIYYFSEILTQVQADARANGGEECWDLVIDNILSEPKAKNVIIMTDQDIGHDYGYAGHHGCRHGKGAVVDGCVWFIWKNGSRVIEAPMKLRGKQGTFQYQFSDY